MNLNEIQKLCLNGTSVYLDFLTEKEAGLIVIEIYSIEKLSDLEFYKLRLSKKIYDLDMIVFSVKGIEYGIGAIKIVEYDIDTNSLLILPSKELKSVFIDIKNNDIFVISDLKFLVERVESWYKSNGEKIRLPKEKPVINYNDIKFLDGKNPSINQKIAIQNIFENQFSYVWGAPGTGKTQYVLAYCVLHYIRKGKKVGIFAPTNNALEQVLRGVLKLMSSANIDHEKIIRLGSPTKKFAEEFPNICEIGGLKKKVLEVNNQIKIIEKKIDNLKVSENIKNVTKALKIVSGIDTFVESRKDIYKELKIIERNLLIKNNNFSSIQNDINTIQFNIDELINTINSFFHKIKKSFIKNQTEQEKQLVKLNLELKQKNKSLAAANNELSFTEKIYKTKKSQHEDLDVANKLISVLKKLLLEEQYFEKIASNINLDNYYSIKAQIEKFIVESKAKLEVSNLLMSDYKSFDLIDMKKKLLDLTNQRDRMISQTTEERLKKVNVIASTIDGYIYRFVSEKLNVDHIFVDEASYVNMVKGLTLFSNRTPITFLGDHYQLPPICEMNDSEFKNHRYKDVFIWSQSSIHIDEVFFKKKDELLTSYLKNSFAGFKKLKKSDLNETHRFGQHLANVLEKYVYQNGFFSANQSGETNIYYIHTVKKIPNEKKRENMNEAQVIKELVNYYDLGDFSILSPYKNQVKLIGSLLPKQRNDHRILTVHGSQGQEWDTIVLSISDTNNKWFTDSQNIRSKGKNLLNTAVSRAKKSLIIVCNYNYWITQDNQLLKGLLDVGKPFYKSV